MARDEGVTKYVSTFRETDAPPRAAIAALIDVRNALFQKGLIGVYADGIGFGNASLHLAGTRQFYISGTQTGHKPLLDARDFSLVTDYDIRANRVACEGLVAASSEAMTHAAIYQLNEHIGCVLHVHSKALWSKYANILPTTDRSIAYGTPAMADAMARLYRDSAMHRVRVVVMSGHEEGILSFGETPALALDALLSLDTG